MSKENKATSHTPLIDHHYKTYHHRQTGRKFQIHHHLAFCCPIGSLRKGIKRDAKEGEKKGGTKGKIVMKTDYASCIIHYIKQAETWQNMLKCLQPEQAHCNMLVTQAFFEDQEIEESGSRSSIIEAKNTRKCLKNNISMGDKPEKMKMKKKSIVQILKILFSQEYK
ncbi:hypothetical protein ACJX0J_036906 [Zea mays]